MNFLGRSSERQTKWPSKYNIYWDASIPMEYYEEDFIEFEDYLIATGQSKKSTKHDLYANSDFYLDLFKAYENDRKRRECKAWKKALEYKDKQAETEATSGKSTTDEKRKKHVKKVS